MKYTNIIVDTNNIFHANFNIQKKLSDIQTPEYILKMTVEKTLLSILSYRKFLNLEGRIICCFDNPTSKIEMRKLIDSDYKANRTKENDGFYRALDFLYAILKVYDDYIYTIREKDTEGDDLIKPLIDSFSKYEKNLLVSHDMDWARMINENTDWQADQIYNLELFREKHGFLPSIPSICLYKTFRGDKSDNIKPGLPGIREEDLLKIVEKYDTIYDVYRDLNLGLSTLLSKTFIDKMKNQEVQSNLFKNFELVSFQNLKINIIEENLIRSKFKKDALRALYISLGIEYKKFDHRFKETEEVSDFFGFQDIPRK